MYGMSEVGVATANTPSVPDGCKAGTAGRPMPGYEIGIFGPDGQALHGPCKIGEICIKGELGFHGYHNRPEDERACFIGGSLLQLKNLGCSGLEHLLVTNGSLTSS